MISTNSRANRQYRRQKRMRNTRSWLHFASGFGAVALIMLVLRGPWLGVPVVLAVILVLQLLRFLIGRSLPKRPGPMYQTDLKDPKPAPGEDQHVREPESRSR